MAFSGGTFSRTFDCTTDRDNGVKILASKFDTELDGMATGLSTCILKDGTQTCTAAIPFAEGLTVPDNKTIVLGTNSDITIQYDESTNDSLEIAANVEGAALGIVLKADQGDDNADQHKVGIADGGTLTMASKISGSFVSYLTHTPNSTVASSTTAVAGNLTVGGDLTLGSGAVISEAELEAIDGVTAGTVTASKAVIVDSNKDIASFRNVTLTGELDAGSLDVSGDADIDGTLETDALSINGTAVTATGAELNYSDTGAAVGTVVASKVVTADANKDVASFRNITLTGELDAGSLDVSGDADIDGTLEADAMTLNGTAITATATLDTGISNNNVPKFTSGVADNDFLRVDGTAVEGRSASEVLSDIAAAPAAGSSNIVTTGALNSGSITSGFGAIDNGSSNITTTGVGTFASLDISGNIDVDGTTNLDVVDIDGAVDMASTLQVDGAITSSAGATITTADNTAQLTLTSTDTDSGHGPRLNMVRNPSEAGADGDNLGQIFIQGYNDAGTPELIDYFQLFTEIADASDGTEDARQIHYVMTGGSQRSRIEHNATETVINEDSVDVDFRVESNGNANMLVVDGGNDRVGIGTGSPVNIIDVIGNGSGSAVKGRIRNEGGASGDDATLELSIATASEEMRILFTDSSGTAGQIVVDGGDNSMAFETGTSERARISSDGDALFGCTALPSASVSGAAFRGTNFAELMCSSGSSTGNSTQVRFLNGNGEVGAIRTNGSETSFVTSSDRRLKKSIEPLQATDKLMQMNPVSFNWKADPSGPRSMGFIAQEMQKIMPDAVTTGNDEDSMMGMDYGRITPILVSALQDAHRKIKQLEQRIANMENN